MRASVPSIVNTENIKEDLAAKLAQHLADARATKTALEAAEAEASGTRFKIVSFSKSLAEKLSRSQPDVTASVIHSILRLWQKSYKYRDGEKKCAFRSLNDLTADIPFLPKTSIYDGLQRLLKAKLLVKGEKRNARSSYVVPDNIFKKYYKGKKLISFVAEDAKRHGVFAAVLINNLRFAVQSENDGIDRRAFEEDASKNRYYQMATATLAEYLPYCERRIADKLRKLTAENVILRYSKSSWYFHYSEGTKPNTSGTNPNTPSPETERNNLTTNVLEAEASPVYIKTADATADAVPCNFEASRMPPNPLASLAEFRGLSKLPQSNPTPENAQSLATLARLAVEGVGASKRERLRLATLAGLPDAVKRQARPMTTAQKISRLLPNEITILLDALTTLKERALFAIDESDLEAFELSGGLKDLRFSAFDLERIANIFLDTGITLSEWNDMVAINTKTYTNVFERKYATHYDAQTRNHFRSITTVEKYYPANWDTGYFWKRITTPEQFWKYLPKLIREACFTPTKPIEKNGKPGPIKWVLDTETDSPDVTIYQLLLEYLQSDTFNSIQDTGIDVIALLNEKRNYYLDHPYTEVDSFEAIEGDPDYGVTSK